MEANERHGGADALGIASAVDLGYDMVRHQLLSKITETLSIYHHRPTVAAEAPADEVK